MKSGASQGDILFLGSTIHIVGFYVKTATDYIAIITEHDNPYGLIAFAKMMYPKMNYGNALRLLLACWEDVFGLDPSFFTI